MPNNTMSVSSNKTRIISKSFSGYKLLQANNIIKPYNISSKNYPLVAPEIIKFQIIVHEVIQRPRDDHDDKIQVDGSHKVTETITPAAFFREKKTAYTLLDHVLSPMGVTGRWQREMLSPAVYAFTNALIADPMNVGRQWLGVLVEIDVKMIDQTLSRFYRNESKKRPRFCDVVDVDEEDDDKDLNKKKRRTNDEECSICLEKLTEDKDFVKLPCSHMFHWGCIINSVLRTSASCPLCRRRLVVPIPRTGRAVA